MHVMLFCHIKIPTNDIEVSIKTFRRENCNIFNMYSLCEKMHELDYLKNLNLYTKQIHKPQEERVKDARWNR